MRSGKQLTPESILSHYKADHEGKEAIDGRADLVLPVAFPQLTPKQRKMLAVEFLPDSIDMNMADKARMAGVSHRHWRRFVATETFKRCAAELAQIVYGKYTLKLVHAEIRDAVYGGAYGFGDAKVRGRILEKLGIYSPAKDTDDANGTGGVHYHAPVTNIFSGVSGDEADAIRRNIAATYRF